MTKKGVEQGGPNSSEQYKLYNNEQLSVAQLSHFGINIGSEVISSVGQADDSVLISSDFTKLAHLLKLTLNYCQKYHVIVTPEKTKLLVFTPDKQDAYAEYYKACNYLEIDGVPLSFVDSAEHVGVTRAVSGNLPHILQRIASHKRSLNAVLSAGMARHHRGNPAASLSVERIYSLPVLLSGVATLNLLESEVDTLSHHYKETVQGLLKLHQATPDPVVYFLGGCLPLRAHLHMRQITLFLMITQFPENILNKIAFHILTTARDSTISWFTNIKKLCYQYCLPHPLQLLKQPPVMTTFKNTVKLKVTDFWRRKLIIDAAPLDSLLYLNTNFMSLQTPHPLWTSCSSNPYEVQKAVVQSRMLSGRYRDDRLARHFSPNSTGECLVCLANGVPNPPWGDLPHILLHCPALSGKRALLDKYWHDETSQDSVCRQIIDSFEAKPEKYKMQFLLDSSTLPDIIQATQIHGSDVQRIIFKLTRTFCYSLHRERLQKLDRWK